MAHAQRIFGNTKTRTPATEQAAMGYQVLLQDAEVAAHNHSRCDHHVQCRHHKVEFCNSGRYPCRGGARANMLTDLDAFPRRLLGQAAQRFP